MPAARCCRRFWIAPPRRPQSSPWEIHMWPRIFPRCRIIFVLFPTPAFRKSARSKRSSARSPFAAIFRSAFPTSRNGAPESSALHNSQRKDRNMRIPTRLNPNSQLALTLIFGALLALPGCNVNVKKDREGKDNNVDIETPVGGLHVSKDADVRDIGLPVYAGARRKEKSDDDNPNSAHINISTSLFGIKVVAVEYLSDDPPEKLVAYYKDQL